MVRSCKIWDDITFIKLVELVGGPIISNVEITRLPSRVTKFKISPFNNVLIFNLDACISMTWNGTMMINI